MDDTGPGGLLLLIAVIAYFTPAIVATMRKAVNRGSVGVINLLLGWTVLGWIVALAMAMGRTEAQERSWHAQGQGFNPQPPQINNATPPGWYPVDGGLRWWNGSQWHMGPDGFKGPPEPSQAPGTLPG